MTNATLTTAASNFLSAFDGAIDEFCTNGTKFNVENMLQRSNLRPADLIAIQTKLQKTTDELELLVIDADEQLAEGYSNLTKAQQRELLAMYHVIMERNVAKVRKVKRAPRDVIVSVIETAVVEKFKTVLSYCEKYRVIRAFIGNVEVKGSTIKCDRMVEVKFAKDTDVSVVANMSMEDAISFVNGGTNTNKTFTKLSNLDVHTLVKFN
jgi:hypothetical protein